MDVDTNYPLGTGEEKKESSLSDELTKLEATVAMVMEQVQEPHELQAERTQGVSPMSLAKLDNIRNRIIDLRLRVEQVMNALKHLD